MEIKETDGNGITLDDALVNVPIGWHAIIYFLYDLISKSKVNVDIRQTKEKFGRLRIYYNVSEKTVNDESEITKLATQIQLLEKIASVICKGCGKMLCKEKNESMPDVCGNCKLNFEKIF